MSKFLHGNIGKGRERSEHNSWGHTTKGKGSSPSHRLRCKDFYVTTKNKARKLKKHLSKHPHDLQAKTAI